MLFKLYEVFSILRYHKFEDQLFFLNENILKYFNVVLELSIIFHLKRTPSKR